MGRLGRVAPRDTVPRRMTNPVFLNTPPTVFACPPIGKFFALGEFWDRCGKVVFGLFGKLFTTTPLPLASVRASART